jgi:hypothetical protein
VRSERGLWGCRAPRLFGGLTVSRFSLTAPRDLRANGAPRIFTAEFYTIGALFATYGATVLGVSVYRRYEGNRQFFSEVGGDGLGRKRFRTSGNAVVVMTALSLAAYASLITLTIRLGDE